MKLAHYKAVLCEGAAEEAIIDILLDNNCLIFSREQLIEERPLRVRQAKHFECMYLRKQYKDKISVLRILDSKKECFNLSKAYRNKVDVINIITAPEIEMLIILNENKYDDFDKAKKKPSDYCKINLGLKNIKSYENVYKYFRNVNDLIKSILKYDSYHKKASAEYTLKDLLKQNVIDRV